MARWTFGTVLVIPFVTLWLWPLDFTNPDHVLAAYSYLVTLLVSLYNAVRVE